MDFLFYILLTTNQVADIVDLIQGLSYIPYRKAIFHEDDDPFHEIKNDFEEFISKTSLIQLPITSSIASVEPERPIINQDSSTSCPSSSPKGCSTSNGVSVNIFQIRLCK